MDNSAHDGVAPKLTAVVLFLLTGASLLSQLLEGPLYPSLLAIAAIASPLVFLCACVVVFFRPRLGYGLGLAAGLIALGWFVGTERTLEGWNHGNSWLLLNYPGPPAAGWPLGFAHLRILSVALILISLACASLRLFPSRWSLRGSPLRRCTWPAFAFGFLVLAVWFVRSVTPYCVTTITDVIEPEVRILHVQKRGLHIHETTVTAYRDGKVFVVRHDRRLFQYRFEGRATLSLAPFQRVRPFVQSTGLWKLRTPVPEVLRSWNADGWYVVLQDSRLLAFTSEFRRKPPKEVTDLFQELEKLPASQEQPFVLRDVCLGFCYDPVAALGFDELGLRARLLSRSASGVGPARARVF